ncbi:conserved hypothetical protein [Micrococcus luteus]|uniref:DUF6932 family protein n=1 Tax=Micrococcus luteus TaxID=1270 RepID=UPI0012F47516|nr:hypothetical protein [Micrococcus luteus]VWX52493.1 conserved hypothetical protein [Micrococcus luteus]
MSLAYDFGNEGFLPPGRFTVSWDEAEALLVHDARFASSSSREQIWQNITDALAHFLDLEDKYVADLPGPLMHRLWLGGSFVSAKPDPRNADCTLWLHHDSVDALRGRVGAALLKQGRRFFERRHGIALIQVTHRPVAGMFDPRHISPVDADYFRDRGRWDDWWQRTRLAPNTPPSLESAYPRRGYLEVILDA